jgi:PAS domain S-box-containing protein
VRAPSRCARRLRAVEELGLLGSWELDLRSRESTWSNELYRLLGLEPSAVELSLRDVLELVHPDDRPRLEALMSSFMTEASLHDGIDLGYRIARADGAAREMRILGRVEREAGEAVRLVGIVQDVTAQRLTERELYAHYGINRSLREWESFEEGAVSLLRRVATSLDYELASFWLWSDEQAGLACRAFWHAPYLDPGDFEFVKRAMIFRPGEGNPGRAWQTLAPVVTPDIARDPQFAPRAKAVELGLRSALAFPAVAGADPVAVVSLYSFESRSPSPSLLRTLMSIGEELGEFLNRHRGQFEPRRLSGRELEILRLASEGLTGPEIAELLVLSPWTVKTHFENVYEKLGVSDRGAAIALAVRTGLIP